LLKPAMLMPTEPEGSELILLLLILVALLLLLKPAAIPVAFEEAVAFSIVFPVTVAPLLETCKPATAKFSTVFPIIFSFVAKFIYNPYSPPLKVLFTKELLVPPLS